MPAELVKLFVWVPAELRQAIKVEAARSRRSMRAVIVEALSEWLRMHPGGQEFDARD